VNLETVNDQTSDRGKPTRGRQKFISASNIVVLNRKIVILFTTPRAFVVLGFLMLDENLLIFKSALTVPANGLEDLLLLGASHSQNNIIIFWVGTILASAS